MRVLLALAVTIALGRLIAWALRRAHQPPVIGEMLAGIALGPSILGYLAPAVSSALLPAAVVDHLGTIGLVGSVAYMFVVGLEFDPVLLRGRSRAALVISPASIVAPFL